MITECNCKWKLPEKTGIFAGKELLDKLGIVIMVICPVCKKSYQSMLVEEEKHSILERRRSHAI